MKSDERYSRLFLRCHLQMTGMFIYYQIRQSVLMRNRVTCAVPFELIRFSLTIPTSRRFLRCLHVAEISTSNGLSPSRNPSPTQTAIDGYRFRFCPLTMTDGAAPPILRTGAVCRAVGCASWRRPRIHDSGRGYGFRARASRARNDG